MSTRVTRIIMDTYCTITWCSNLECLKHIEPYMQCRKKSKRKSLADFFHMSSERCIPGSSEFNLKGIDLSLWHPSTWPLLLPILFADFFYIYHTLLLLLLIFFFSFFFLNLLLIFFTFVTPLYCFCLSFTRLHGCTGCHIVGTRCFSLDPQSTKSLGNKIICVRAFTRIVVRRPVQVHIARTCYWRES